MANDADGDDAEVAYGRYMQVARSDDSETTQTPNAHANDERLV